MIKKGLILFFLVISMNARAGHLMGGEITWECRGNGNFVFQLHVYRDCQGPALSTTGQQLLVWNHPTLNSIPLNFISQNDISPVCNAVNGGPPQITCGSSTIGAVEDFIFESAEISIVGIPPVNGWAFTWDDFSRNLSIDNLQTPGAFGITIRSFMYENIATNTSPCFDNSPVFSISPPTVVCAGENIRFNFTAFDPDLDSLVFSFAEPLSDIVTTFNPPATPVVIPYVAGFSFTNPTPDNSFNAANIPAAINSQSGEVNFTSANIGNFVIVVKVASFRNGIIISEVYRDLQIAVVNCGANTSPDVTPPFAAGTSFSTTVTAGSVVNFTLLANDFELLQDGSPQTLTINAVGSEFGTGFTNAVTGCDQAPCATLNSGLPISGIQTTSLDFNWQTDCVHLSSNGSAQTYNFVFSISDDFCQVPGTTNPVISITVLPLSGILAPEIKCANVALNGDITLTWSQPADPDNSFINYEVYEAGSNTLLSSITNYNTLSFLHIGADGQNGSRSYYVKVNSGCNGEFSAQSNTVNSIFLNVNNPGNGTAILQWNALYNPNISTSTGYYYIWQEYPLGTWTMIDSVLYGMVSYVDTISICEDTLNYKVIAEDNSGCFSESSIDGENFTDQIAPDVPIIQLVTVDTLTGEATIVWNVNPDADTEGYIILQNIGGNWVILDTVFGINNTQFINPNSIAGMQSELYGVAAFDSCWSGTPASPNTSAMGINHNTIFVSTTLDICEQEVQISWNDYINWNGGVDRYELYASENNGAFGIIYSGTNTVYNHLNVNRNSTYCYVIIAYSVNGNRSSVSNKICRFIYEPDKPNFHYLQVATVNPDATVDLRLHSDLTAAVSQYRFERSDNSAGPFDIIGYGTPVSNPYTFNDPDAITSDQSYFYRAIAIDSCGDDASISNVSKTIHLYVSADNLLLRNSLIWNLYEGWNGNVIEYRIYRGIDGVFDSTPIGTTSFNTRYYEDDVSDLLETPGEFCYYVEAVESLNLYGIDETSQSNRACVIQQPLIYVPNAMVVGGVNSIFKPVISYSDYESYDLKIFNRWGELVFQTNDVYTGWDGRADGIPLKEGVYIWVIEIKDGAENFLERRGHVTLLYDGSN